MSAITKLLGGMMKGLRRRNFVIEDLFTEKCKTPGKEKRKDSRSTETETAIRSISLPEISCFSIEN